MTRLCARVAVPLGVLLAFACTKPEPAAKPIEPAAAPAVAAKTSDDGKDVTYCAQIRQCTDCPNDVFIPTECYTTQYGPSRANVITVPEGGNALTSTNMLYCNGGHYALCFFSGPPNATGNDPNTNPKLPCLLDGSGDFARCTCQAFTNGAFFVDIHSIGNLRVYYQTVDACGVEGEKCQNMVNCGHDGSKAGCLDNTPPPVCSFVQNQDPRYPQVSLIPGADMISTFSFAMDSDYTLGTTECPNADHLPYAGCMTAACNFVGTKPTGPYDGNPIECKCPTWNGPYQVGQTLSSSQCIIPNGAQGEKYVWSAAYTVTPTKPTT
jgi:hypothetical protein